MTDRSRGQRHDAYGIAPGAVIKLVLSVVGSFAIAMALWVWFGWRISVGAGEYVALLKKTGDDMSNDMVVAPGPEYKGVQLEILKEGRHFKNPLYYAWDAPRRATIIPEGQVGVLVRRYGRPLPPGNVVASAPDERGIVRQTLGPGRHYLNLRAFDVEIHPSVKVAPGHVGVVTLRAGAAPKNPNAFLVEDGEKGVQRSLVPAGTHPINPYVEQIIPIDIRSHKFEMTGVYSITFPSSDGFDIVVEGTCEWAPVRERVPEVFVKYVDRDDLEKTGGIGNIQRKLILPYARSFSRIVGSKHPAVDFISGETRTAFQTEVLRRLRDACSSEGILVKTVVIRNTKPPERIRAQYQAREIAKREKDQYTQEIARERVRKEQMLQQLAKARQTDLGDIRKEIAGLVRKAEENREVVLTLAEQKFEVAKKELEAAKNRASAIRAKGLAEAEVVVMQNTAEANAIRAEVEAFGDGATFARFKLMRKLAPAIDRIFSNTDGPFADLFQGFTELSPPAPPVAPPPVAPAKATETKEGEVEEAAAPPAKEERKGATKKGDE